MGGLETSKLAWGVRVQIRHRGVWFAPHIDGYGEPRYLGIYTHPTRKLARARAAEIRKHGHRARPVRVRVTTEVVR